MTVLIEYALIDTPDTDKEFDTVAEAIAWVQGIGEDMFTHVSLNDIYDNYVDGYSAIIKAYEDNKELYAGEDACIHLNTKSVIGGGIHCCSCPAWFCY